MIIPQSDIRDKMNNLGSIHRESKGLTNELKDKIKEANEKIGKIQGVKLLENIACDKERCAEFALLRYMGEKFKIQGNGPLWDFPLLYLKVNGYSMVFTSPQEGDLVVYTNEFNMAAHFGIYQGNNKVISKFGDMGIFFHDIEKVSTRYGIETFFLRKND